jgi:hypothetical protein
MLPTSFIFPFGGAAIANAAPQSFVYCRQEGWSKETAFITFWENGCGVDGEANQATFTINESDALHHSGDCVKLG